MLINYWECYSNKRNDGKEFHHDTKEAAEVATRLNPQDYISVAEHRRGDMRSCDKCTEQGKISFGVFRAEHNMDLCYPHYISAGSK